jgi:hypothetical protein
MKTWITYPLICCALSTLVATATASSINVTGNSQVTLGNNDSLLFYISSNLSSGGQGGLACPTEIEMVLGGMPLGGLVSSIPGTSSVYMPDELFSGAIESQDGSVSIPLTDSDASHLGLPGGDIVLVPGSYSGGPYSGPADLISADVTLSSQEAAALFASGEAVIDLHNIGGNMTFGYTGAPITNDFSASLIGYNGGQSEGARVMQVDCVHTPEPATIGLLLIGLAIILPRVLRQRGLRS